MPVQKRKEIAMANMYRDVNLSEVNESYIGKELKVAGWVENIRDHGGVSFIDLTHMLGRYVAYYLILQHIRCY